MTVVRPGQGRASIQPEATLWTSIGTTVIMVAIPAGTPCRLA
ncbi:hypothetical protein AB0395_23850 [Streptosporangium sp. NPDC051023]